MLQYTYIKLNRLNKNLKNLIVISSRGSSLGGVPTKDNRTLKPFS